MLVLSRKKDEKIVIGDNISIMVVDIRRDRVRLGIDAPREVSVHRSEVYNAIQGALKQANREQKIEDPGVRESQDWSVSDTIQGESVGNK